MPDTRQEHNAHVQKQSDMEHAFAAYFGDLVSEWNPCCDDDGKVRFLWDEELGAHDVEATGGVSPACPERTRLRAVLDGVFDAKDGAVVDLTPVRRLVAALVQSSGRHKLHQMGPPTLGKHVPLEAGVPGVPLRLSPGPRGSRRRSADGSARSLPAG